VSRSKSPFAFDDVPFERRLAETIAWCAPRSRASDPRLSLRSEALSPSLLAPDRRRAIDMVASLRAPLVRGTSLPAGPGPLAGGRLLVYFPDADLADGAAEDASQGFFDLHNVPPWDTWIALGDDGPQANLSYRQYVVAWVPAQLVACATAGINVNPEHCIAWLEAADVRARDELRLLLAE
jgi:hypothetical protein